MKAKNYTLYKKRHYLPKVFLWISIIAILSTALILLIKNEKYGVAGILISVIILTCEVRNFIKYHQKKYPHLKKSDKYSFSHYFNDKNFIIAETNLNKLVQIIKGKNSYYIHYLTINKNGHDFDKNSLITDFKDIDTVKKYNQKDFRINFNSIKNIKYDRYSENISVLKNSGTLIFMIQSGSKAKTFYPVSDNNIPEFFSDNKNFSKISKKSDCNDIRYLKSFLDLGWKRIFYIIIKNLYFIATVFSFFSYTYTMNLICCMSGIFLIAVLLIFYCINSDEYDFFQYSNSDSNNDFSLKPNIAKSIITPVFINLLYAINNINLITYSKYIIISLICSAVLSLVLIIFSSERAISILISLCIAFTSVIHINYFLDFDEPAVFTSQIYEKSSHNGSRGSKIYEVQIAMNDGKKQYIRISGSEYRNCNEGETAEIYQYKGFLGIPYIEIIFEYEK